MERLEIAAHIAASLAAHSQADPGVIAKKALALADALIEENGGKKKKKEAATADAQPE